MYPINKEGNAQFLSPVENRIDDTEAVQKAVFVGFLPNPPSHHFIREALFYCPTCGDVRRGRIQWDPAEVKNNSEMIPIEGYCLQCKHRIYFLLHKKNKKWDLIYSYDTNSGISTPNTPHNVQYYLDQAFRCKCAGAMSASMAMYRAALDSILFNAGYTKGMLGSRIQDLEKDISDNKAPEGLNIDTDFIRVLKDLGNGAVHTNDGDISKQETYDRELLHEVDVVISELLDSVYETPARKKARLAKLNTAKQQVSK